MNIAAADSRAARAAATISRILDSATMILRTEGAAAVSVQRVASAAGTSKALVHYHFSAKDALLVACIERVSRELIDEERAALDASTPTTALDDVWNRLMNSRMCGTRRALLALTTDATDGTQTALAAAARARRDRAVATVQALTRLLDFSSGAPTVAVARAFLAMIDGLTLDASAGDAEQRRAFDAFWLAVLSVDR